MPTTIQQAQAFAARWYARPDSGCDEPTLASMLAEPLSDAFRAGVEAERERLMGKLRHVLGVPEIKPGGLTFAQLKYLATFDKPEGAQAPRYGDPAVTEMYDLLVKERYLQSDWLRAYLAPAGYDALRDAEAMGFVP